MSTYVGADGSSDGWVAIVYEDSSFKGVEPYKKLEELYEAHLDAETILVDVPIGLHDSSDTERADVGRECDSKARDILGWPRSSSVFTPPIRKVLDACSYDRANSDQKVAIGKGLMKQTYNIFPLIRQADEIVETDTQAKDQPIREAHPEVCFAALAAGQDEEFRSPRFSKTSQPAQAFWERVSALESADPDLFAHLKQAGKQLADHERNLGLKNDDLLDAFALAVTASNLTDELKRLGVDSEESADQRGLPMEMVYAEP